MAQKVNQIKSRIKSVSGAYKVTGAMKLVSTVKLKQLKNKMLANKEYNQELQEVVDLLLTFSNRVNSPYFTINSEARKKLYVIISSTLGLCGSYNNNIFKVSDVSLSQDDEAIILGQKGLAHYKDNEFKIHRDIAEGYQANNKEAVARLANFIMEEYQKGTYSEIHIIYSEYKNSLVFLAKDYKLLPLVNESKDSNDYSPIIEPSKKELVETLVPFFIKSELYSKLLESEVCEQGARSNAMENATNNAKEILDELKIEFNKARQTAITQEITEIVAAAKAI